MHSNQKHLPTWDRGTWEALAKPPQPGPVKASERRAWVAAHLPIDVRSNTPAAQRYRELRLKRDGVQHFVRHKQKLAIYKSLKLFVQEIWNIVEPGTPLVWSRYLDTLCEVLEKVTAGELKRVIINVPPGHMKSLLVSVFWPAWIWLEDPGWRSIFASYSAVLSERDAQRCRDLIESDKYAELKPRLYGLDWKQRWQLKDDQNAKRFYQTTLNGFRIATSVDGAGTGLRGDLVCIDDPMNVEEFPTQERLNGINSWFDKRMSSRLSDMQKGRFVLIMQRLHENDLAGHLLEQNEENKNTPGFVPWEHVCLPSEFDPARASKYDHRTTAGELLFEERFPRAVLDRARIDLGPAQYSAQHDQDPTPASGGLFPVWKFRFWYPSDQPAPNPVLEKDDQNNLVACVQEPLPDPKRFSREIQSWDCAFKDTKASDFVSGQYWAQLAAKVYLLEQRYGRFSFSKTLDQIRELSFARPKGFAKYVEDKANGPAVIDTLQNELFGVTPVEPEGGKVARAHAVTPLIHAGNVYLPHPVYFPWVKHLLAELRAFPRAKHDDQVDALTQALRQLASQGASFIEAMAKF